MAGGEAGDAGMTWFGRDMKHLWLTAHRPGLAYAITCSTFCLTFVLWIVLMIAAPGFIEFSTEVPIYLRSDIRQKNFDALAAGKTDAKFSPTNTTEQLPRTVTVDDDGLDLQIELIYLPENGVGDIFELDNLRKIRDVENQVMGLRAWHNYCMLDWDSGEQGFAAASRAQDTAQLEKYRSAEFLSRLSCSHPRSVMWGCWCPEGTHATVINEVYGCRAAGGTTPITGCDFSHPFPRGPDEERPTISGENNPLKADPNSPGNNSVPGWPPGLLNCKRADGCRDGGKSSSLYEFDPDYVRRAVNYYGQGDPYTDWSVYSFVFESTDSTFGGGQTTGRALRSVFKLGIPIAGYESSDDRQEEQVDTITSDLYDELHDLLFEKDFGIDVWFDGPGLLDKYIEAVLMQDGLWAIGSMIFVWLYIVFMNGSWFLGTMGMGQILMAFGPAYIVYFVLGFRYFGTFNVLTIFIILGIGADDIFVFLDTWGQSELEFPVDEHPESMPEEERRAKDTLRRHLRMSWTWKRAAKAMLVTSSTTMASFLMTGTSSFPGIQTFGIFAAMLVLVNYSAVITYYPCVVAYNDVQCVMSYGCAPGPFCCGLTVRLQRLGAWINTQAQLFSAERDVWAMGAQNADAAKKRQAGVPVEPPSSQPVEVEAAAAPAEEKAGEVDEAAPKLRGVELFFYKSYAPFIIHFRWPVLACCLAFIVAMTVMMAKMEADPDPPQFLPKSNNYGGFKDVKGAHFARGGSVFAIELRIVSGFDPLNPIDRSGTKDTDPKDTGSPVWAEWQGPAVARPKPGPFASWGLDLIPEGLPCFLHICEQAVIRDDVRKVGGMPEYPITCWVASFKRWVDKNDTRLSYKPTATWAQMTGKFDGIDYDGDGSPDGAAYWDGTNSRWVQQAKPWRAQELFLENLQIWLQPPEVYDVWKPFLYGQVAESCFNYPRCSEGTSRLSSDPGCCDDPADASCACSRDAVFRFHYAEMRLTATIKMLYEDGLDLVKAWNSFLAAKMDDAVCRDVCRAGMGNNADPPCATPVFLTDEAGIFAFFRVQEVMIQEAFSGIGISLALAFGVITTATMNIVSGTIATATIAAIVMCVLGFSVSIGWKLGVVQAVVFVMVPGMAVDYVAHLTEAYTEAHAPGRNDRVRLMLTEVGISVISGAFSTLGASVFLLMPIIMFFNTFGIFMFATIFFSLTMALLLLPSVMAILGPEGDFGSFKPFLKKYLLKKTDGKVAPAQSE